MQLDDKLQQLRKCKGLTQADLAEKLEVSRQSISSWEVGSITPSVERLKALSRLYDVPLDYLLNDEKEDLERESSEENQEDLERNTNSDEKADRKVLLPRIKKRIGVSVVLVVCILLVLLVTMGIYAHEKAQLYDEMSDSVISNGVGSDFQLDLEW